MREWLKKHFPVVDKYVDRIGYWAGFFLLLWTIMSGIVSSISSVSQYGWGAVILAAFGVVCVFALVISACLVAWRYFHPIQRHLSPYDWETYTYDPAIGAPDREAYFGLVDFVVQYLWPACDRQIDLQKAIIREAKADDFVIELAIEGLPFDSRPNAQTF